MHLWNGHLSWVGRHGIVTDGKRDSYVEMLKRRDLSQREELTNGLVIPRPARRIGANPIFGLILSPWNPLTGVFCGTAKVGRSDWMDS